MLSRLGRWCHNRRVVVVIAWLAVLVGFGVASGLAGSGYTTQFGLPKVESARGLDIIDTHFGGRGGGGGGGTIVFRSDQGVNDPAVESAMTTFLAQASKVPDINIVSPYSPQGAMQISRRGDNAGKIAYAKLEVGRGMTIEKGKQIADAVRANEPKVPGLEIEYGGQLFQKFQPPSSETLGLAFAIVILILAFGSVLAMGLPIGTAIGGIGLGTAIVGLLSNVMTMPSFTSTLAVMIGLGVGIDYALFIVTRYREGLHHGFTSERAAAVAINTAGRAVLFAGTTVVISLLGMLLMNLAFVRGLAIGAAITVLMTMAASVTLLPALLGFAARRVEVTRWRGMIAAGLFAVALLGMGAKLRAFAVLIPVAAMVIVAGFFVPALKREIPRPAPKPVAQTLPYRWSRLVQHHPWASVLIGVALLVTLAAPVLSLRLGFSDEGNLPTSTTTRRAYDLLASGFGPGFNGPLVLAAEVPAGTSPDALAKVSAALAKTTDVVFASPAIPDDPANPKAVLWQVVPKSAPQDAATTRLVDHLRSDVLPAATEGTGLKVAVSGFVATGVDFSEYLAARLPLFIGVVLALSFLLLLVVFRSVLVPLKAVVMNLISIGAAYGLVVIVFQWGWGKELIGVGKGGPIEPFVPMMMFAIVFGLSMDYEVFLLSRIKEEYDRGSANDRAVADGLAATARVITAAAAIMVFVFGSFIFETERVIKLFGVGLASAVLLDATVVRMLLVPATMELLGDRNWWVPRWLGRILPRIDVEGHGPDTVAEIESDESVTVAV
ncbi:MAG TPA: MMPL family transporter [Acidimicrobiales bacterium]|nr:MMPL family transporter [Acidimicrobiales bacterium]